MVINTTAKSLNSSLRAKYDLDIEQLDYKFIRKCDTVKTIENILKVLRSGEEGVYPDLVRFTEDRLRALKPNSSLLRTEKPATALRALDREARDEVLSDLKQWKHEVSTADAELKLMSAKSDMSDSQLPPVRGAVQLDTAGAREPSPTPLQKLARIPSGDYAAWDRYDVEAQLKLLDESAPAAAPEQPAEHSDPAIDESAARGGPQRRRAQRAGTPRAAEGQRVLPQRRLQPRRRLLHAQHQRQSDGGGVQQPGAGRT